MAQDALEESLARPFGVKSRGAGQTLLARRIFDRAGTFTDVAPAGTTSATVRCIGPGGPGGSPQGGGGGAFAKDTLPCSPSTTITIVVQNPVFGEVNSTTVTVGPYTVKAVGASNGDGGIAANCVGSVRRSGGTGGVYPNAGQPGIQGGPGGNSGTNGSGTQIGGGGGSGGDRGDSDAAIFGGRGGGGLSGQAPGYGGGEGAFFGPAWGAAVIEYWSA